ncbi:MAG: hypothetical protein WD766_08315 [Gemmatimonadota bacterium]
MDEHTPGEGGPANTPPFPRIVPEEPGSSARGEPRTGAPAGEAAESDERVVAEAVARPVIEEPDIPGGDPNYARSAGRGGEESGFEGDTEPLPPRSSRGSGRSRARRRPGPFPHFADRLDEIADRIDHVVDEQLAAAGVGGRTAEVGHTASEAIGGIADYLRSSDVRSLRDDLASQVRERPVQTLLVAVGTGWLFGKIVR